MSYEITYFLEEENKIADYIFNWLSIVTGYKFKKIQGGEDDIYYGNNPVKCKINIKRSSCDLLWDSLINDGYEKLLNNNVNFDIINAISCFISDKVNSTQSQSSFDTHSRLVFKYS